ncbi:MAG: hypothetical protein IPK76_00915 [Lewinellaceae bacterium]|jgi:hypothetical protein|nr:hypothetical protein [Lewinellaceae bacterium]
MKRVFVWILILQFITGHNLLAELVRTPSLLEHYQTHRQETPDLSFATFIWLHYCNPQHEQSDSRHAGLPLHCEHGIAAESVVPMPLVVEISPDQAIPVREGLPILEERIPHNDYSFGLFRPPIA